jgi:hypothetical protein
MMSQTMRNGGPEPPDRRPVGASREQLLSKEWPYVAAVCGVFLLIVLRAVLL